ncbi:hypothetical protein [Streptomyces sp. NPDC058295]|uniref:hypothetical protein n=1 Tax=Streptomyces sp. NPDC058295 TaxID=3346431 RepID=UPI0036EED2A3
MTTQNAIGWPEKYLPGTGDNFVSNEVIVQGLTAAKVWRFLIDTSEWADYYDNVADISFPQGRGPELKGGVGEDAHCQTTGRAPSPTSPSSTPETRAHCFVEYLSLKVARKIVSHLSSGERVRLAVGPDA